MTRWTALTLCIAWTIRTASSKYIRETQQGDTAVYTIDWRTPIAIGIAQYGDLEVDCGDKIVFEWNDNLPHNVALLKEEKNCLSEILPALFQDGRKGSYTWTVTPSEQHAWFFACTSQDHCDAGQQLTVLNTCLIGDGADAPGMAPGPAPGRAPVTGPAMPPTLATTAG